MKFWVIYTLSLGLTAVIVLVSDYLGGDIRFIETHTLVLATFCLNELCDITKLMDRITEILSDTIKTQNDILTFINHILSILEKRT